MLVSSNRFARLDLTVSVACSRPGGPGACELPVRFFLDADAVFLKNRAKGAIFHIFHNMWDVNLPIDFHIFQRGSYTTNQWFDESPAAASLRLQRMTARDQKEDWNSLVI
jgi:hypothetical protein